LQVGEARLSRWPHKPEFSGSNPLPTTILEPYAGTGFLERESPSHSRFCLGESSGDLLKGVVMRKLVLALVLIVGCMSYSPVSAQTAKEWKAIHIVQRHLVGDSTVLDILTRATYTMYQEGVDIQPVGWGATVSPEDKDVYKVMFIMTSNGDYKEADYFVSISTKKVIGGNDLGEESLGGNL
jgi:hypothetical protein